MEPGTELFRVGGFSLRLCKNTRWNSVIDHDCPIARGTRCARSRSGNLLNKPGTYCIYCGVPTPEEIRTVWILHNFDLIGDKK